ncbi:NBS-LRR protein [Artemisia annua]|uniref:NBS-LRR protein n=1 Tax=Artemisia annua TaxID=35608 RepID=A0A2U1L6E4_ARTAN|nr:NBS-LRR protein [Artemisia annua]
MAELILSALLPVIFEKLTSVAVNKIARSKEIHTELKKWEKKLSLIQAFLEDASQKEVTKVAVKQWLNGLQHLAYEIDDILDALATDAINHEFTNESEGISTKVRKLIPTCCTNFSLSTRMDGKLNGITTRKNQTSLVDERSIVGREGDKNELLEKLLGDEPCSQNFSLVPIVGGAKKEFEDLNLLQSALKNQLTGKRFLLVLDDIWSENLEDWETLVAPFFDVAHGSKIIITTRKQHLLNKLGYDHPYDLKKLSHDDALSLFAQYALGVKNFDLHPVLRPHGEGIVRKCDGLPLALKALGSLLRTKTDEEDWKQLLNSDIWMLEDGGGIVPVLRLSYHDLSAPLKQLFAYCCLIPKDYVFAKDDLILWWMAEGFLHNSTKSMERLGKEYFQELLSRSFFQHVPDEESLFVMHDLMNDLATYVAGEFFVRLDLDVKKDVGKTDFKKFRHMSFVWETYNTYNKFKAFERANSLRTFLAMPNAMGDDSWQRFYLSSKLLVDILRQLPLLRVLSLRKLEIVVVPECVGNMKQLRYLNLSQTRITHLPENVCNLYNLQTLIVSGCNSLATLPDNFLKLKNLRHFDIRDTLLWNMMPLGISEMKSLQILSNKVVVENNAFFISWLRNIKNLQAEINIDELQKVQSARDMWEVNLSQKRVSKLHVEWSRDFDDARNETLENEVLNALKPHSDDLKDLNIVSYGALGQLPSLKKLEIRRLKEVKDVGSEFLGTGIAFPKLESLSFEDMSGWEAWSTKSGVVGAVMFPCLEELEIRKCPNLAEVSLEALPSLRVLKVSSCGDGVLRSLIHAASSVTRLSISLITGLSDEVWRGVMDYLGAVEDLFICGCDEISYLWESEAEASKVLVNLRKLKVYGCSKLVSLGEKEDGCNQLTSLTMLDLIHCYSLERCNLPNNIQELSIRFCPMIASVSFPTGGHKLKSLIIIDCEQLPDTELLNTSMPPMLEFVWVVTWKNLKSINELTCSIHLTKSEIEDCSSIESFPAADLPNLTSLKDLTIKGCKSMDVDSFGVWPPKLGMLTIGGLKKPISKFGPQNFPPSLVHLWLYGGSAEEEDDMTSGSKLSHMLPSSLTYLELWYFEKLETVSMGLQHLTSLQHLDIKDCPKMKDLPEELFPSLLSLIIDGCTDELKEKTSRRGSYWPRISYIPRVYIKLQGYTLHEAIGVVGNIIPGNLPIGIFLMKTSPALAAGCTTLVKSAEQSPLSALYLAHLAKLAVIPDEVINVLTGFGETAGAAISSRMDIDSATSNLKAVSLELGGKAPLIVFDDVDLASTVNKALRGGFTNEVVHNTTMLRLKASQACSLCAINLCSVFSSAFIRNYSLCYRNDVSLEFVENFVKDHFLPATFMDYRKGVQKAIPNHGPQGFEKELLLPLANVVVVMFLGSGSTRYTYLGEFASGGDQANLGLIAFYLLRKETNTVSLTTEEGLPRSTLGVRAANLKVNSSSWHLPGDVDDPGKGLRNFPAWGLPGSAARVLTRFLTLFGGSWSQAHCNVSDWYRTAARSICVLAVPEDRFFEGVSINTLLPLSFGFFTAVKNSKNIVALIPAFLLPSSRDLGLSEKKIYWVNSSVFPISVSWHSSVLVEKDPPPYNEGLDMVLLEALNLHRVKFQRYPETFLCVIRLSRVYDDQLSRPTFRNTDRQDMSLLDITKSADPFKVKIGERTLAEGEKTLLEETVGRVVEPSEAELTLVDHTIVDELKSVKAQGQAGKKWGRKDKEASGSGPQAGHGAGNVEGRNADVDMENVQELEVDAGNQEKTVNEEVVVEKEPVVDSGKAPFIELEGESESAPREDSSTNLIARKRRKSTVVSSESGPVNPGLLMVLGIWLCLGQTVDTDRAYDLYSPKWIVTNGFKMNDPWVCRDSEIRQRFEHEIELREKLERRIQLRDNEITSLREQLANRGEESEELLRLRARVSQLESEARVKNEKIAGLEVNKAELEGTVSGLEARIASLTEQVEGLVKARDVLIDRVKGEDVLWRDLNHLSKALQMKTDRELAQLHAWITALDQELDQDLYPNLLKVAAAKRWVIDHGFMLAFKVPGVDGL